MSDHLPNASELPNNNGEGTDTPFAFLDEPITSTHCRRCGKPFDITKSQCPSCFAVNRAKPTDRYVAKPYHQSPAIVRVVWCFAAITLVSIAGSLGIDFTVDTNAPDRTGDVQSLAWLIVLELIDTLIVVWAIYSIPTMKMPNPSHTQRIWAGGLFLPLLLTVLAINMIYHFYLRKLLQLDLETSCLMTTTSWLPLKVLLLCVQPAIVEELFFRRVAMEAAGEMVSPAWALVITSLLFALAHVGQPLSIPVLGIIGLTLGYLRLASGTLWLPMLFHFLHNLAVTVTEG